MTKITSLPALILMSVFALSALQCGDQRNTATEESATGSASDDHPVNTESKTPVKLKEYVVGEWDVVERSAETGDDFASATEVRFTLDGKYIRYREQQQIDSGLYRANEQHRFLYLEPNGDGDPVEWDATIRDHNEMTLIRRQRDKGMTRQFVLQRKR